MTSRNKNHSEQIIASEGSCNQFVFLFFFCATKICKKHKSREKINASRGNIQFDPLNKLTFFFPLEEFVEKSLTVCTVQCRSLR